MVLAGQHLFGLTGWPKLAGSYLLTLALFFPVTPLFPSPYWPFHVPSTWLHFHLSGVTSKPVLHKLAGQPSSGWRAPQIWLHEPAPNDGHSQEALSVFPSSFLSFALLWGGPGSGKSSIFLSLLRTHLLQCLQTDRYTQRHTRVCVLGSASLNRYLWFERRKK